MTDFRVQLFAFKPGSDSQYQLPAPIEWNATMTHSDVGALTLTYPLDATGLNLLNGYVDVEVRRLNSSGVWVCLPQGRFSLSQITPDVLGEEQLPVRRFQFQSFAWQLRGILQERTTGLNDQGQRRFIGKTVAQAVGILIDEAHAVGSAPDLTWEIVSDSGAQVGPVAVGQDVESILSAAHDQGLIDWQVIPDDTGQGRKLAMYSTLGSDKSTGNSPVDLRPGRDVVGAPATMSALDVRPRALVQGDGGTTLLLSNSAADAPYGNLATSVSASGASTVGQLQITGQAALDKARTWRSEETCSIRFESAKWLPFKDYGLGDKVLSPGPLAGMQSQKIQQIVLSLSASDGLGGSVVLGERFVTGPEWLRKRIKQTSGSGWNYNWNPTPPAPYSPPVYTGSAPNYPTGGEVVLSSQPVIPTLGDRMGLPRPCSTSVAPVAGDAYALDTRGTGSGNPLYRFRPADAEWVTLASLPSTDVAHGQCLVSDGADLFACGGTGAAGAVKFDVTAGSWGSSPVGGATQPAATAWGYGGSVGGKVYFGGGQSSSGGAGEGGEFLILASGSTSAGVYTSTDGSTWDWHPDVFPAGAFPTLLAHSPALGVYVAAAGTSIWSSPDGLTWTAGSAAPATVRSLSWADGQGLFVAGMTAADGVLTSPDGSTWTQRSIGAPSSSYQIQAVASSSSRLVVAGGDLGGQFSSWSVDGVTWTYSADLAGKAADGEEPLRMCWADGLGVFVMGDHKGSVWSSPDGAVWTKTATVRAASTVGEVLWADSLSLLVVMVGSYYIYTSPDGVAWTLRLTMPDLVGSVVWSPSLGMLMATCDTTNTSFRGVYTSTDGVVWPSRSLADETFRLRDAVWGAGEGAASRLVVLDSQTSVAVSGDGSTWNETASGVHSNGTGVLWIGDLGRLFMISQTSWIYTSPDATTWTGTDAGSSNMAAANGICWSPELGLAVVVGYYERIITSPDGATWTQRRDGEGANLESVCWSPTVGKFVAVGAMEYVTVSTDGITWTTSSLPTGTRLYSVCWADSLALFVAVGYDASDAPLIYTSPDGTTWTARTASGASTLNGVCWSPTLGLLLAVDWNGNVITSPDGATWTFVTTLANSTQRAFWAAGAGLFCVGNFDDGTLYTSPDGVTFTGTGTGLFDIVGIADMPISTGPTFSGAFYCYDPAANEWSALADGPAVSHAGSCVIDGKVYVFGGRDGTDTLGGYSAGLWCYDPVANTWTTLATGLSAVSDPAVCAANGRVYVLGGEYYTGTGYAPITAVHIYTVSTNLWSSSVDLTVPHTAAGACEIQSYLYVPGGVPAYHDHEADIDGAATDDALFSDVLTVWMAPPSPISTYTGGTGGGWGPLFV